MGAIGLNAALQNGAVVCLAPGLSGDIDPHRHRTIHLEVRMEPTATCHPRLPANMTSPFVTEAMKQSHTKGHQNLHEAKIPAGKESGTAFDRLKPHFVTD